MKYLWEIGAQVRAYDPEAKKKPAKVFMEKEMILTLCDSADAAIDGADALVIVTGWQEFRSPDFAKLKSTLKDPVIVDGRNLYKPEQMKELDITYYAIGRGE